MTNKNRTTLYTGVTADLVSRVMEHQQGNDIGSYTQRYKLTKLVYFEHFPRIEEAIDREKQIKAGSRKKKEQLIESINPTWANLFDQIKDW